MKEIKLMIEEAIKDEVVDYKYCQYKKNYGNNRYIYSIFIAEYIKENYREILDISYQKLLDVIMETI